MRTRHTSALGEAEAAFAWLTNRPTPPRFDARPVPGLPDRTMALEELRDLLIARRFTADVTDVLWRHLAAHARHDGQDWVDAAVGVALPGLTRMAAKIRRKDTRRAEDIDSEMYTGFLHALHHADLAPPRLWLRLCWAAWRAGISVLRGEDTVELPLEFIAGARSPSRPYGHPDLLLGRLAAAGVITADEAELIGATRLGDALIEALAAQRGVSAPALRMRRRRAELAVRAAITSGDISDGGPMTSPGVRASTSPPPATRRRRQLQPAPHPRDGLHRLTA